MYYNSEESIELESWNYESLGNFENFENFDFERSFEFWIWKLGFDLDFKGLKFLNFGYLDFDEYWNFASNGEKN